MKKTTAMREVRSESGELLALFISAEAPRKAGSEFYCQDNDFIQVANHQYEAGKVFVAHQHKEVERKIQLTQEVLFIQKGAIQAAIFDLEHKMVASFTMNKGDLIILLKGGHSFTVLNDDTRFLEVKNGPYLGAEADRFRLFE